MREGWRSESLLVRQMGIYRIKMNELQKPIYFQIMENVHKGLHQMGAGFKACQRFIYVHCLHQQGPASWPAATLDPPPQPTAGCQADLKGSHNTGNSTNTNEGLRDRDLRNFIREGRVQFELADPARPLETPLPCPPGC